FSITNVSYLVNGILPLRIGEVARLLLANRVKPPVPVLKAASSVILERMLDLLAVLLLLGFALAASPTLPEEYRRAASVMVPLLVVGFVVLVIFASQRALVHGLLALFMRWLPFMERLNLSQWLDQFLDGLLPLTRPGLLLRALFWTAASWGFSVA